MCYMYVLFFSTWYVWLLLEKTNSVIKPDYGNCHFLPIYNANKLYWHMTFRCTMAICRCVISTGLLAPVLVSLQTCIKNFDHYPGGA